MKKQHFFLLPLLALLFTGCQKKGNAKVEFWVRGNCEMCKETIETALKDQEGVVSVNWDVDSKIAKVSYDTTRVNAAQITAIPPTVGYETKELSHDEAAYQELPRCCKKMADMR